jgi:predicted O-linked N-acetylglucosamine transferase (SPINDLY family)
MSAAKAHALELFRARRLPEARAALEAACAQAGDDAEAWYLLGVIHGLQHNYPEAERCCRRAVELRPGYSEAHGNLGLALAAQGRADEALACYREALRLNPNQPVVHNNLGSALKANGEWPAAKAAYAEALKLKPDYADAHYNLGNLLLVQNQPAEAENAYREAIRFNPQHAGAYGNLGKAQQTQGKLDSAADSYRTAIRLQPQSPGAYNNLGTLLVEQEKFPQALECFHTALRVQPNFAEAYNNLGLAHFKAGHPAEAMAAYQEALRLKPGPEVYNNIANVLIGQERLSEAVEHYRKALALKPDHAEAHNNLGIALHTQGVLEEGMMHYCEAVRLKPDYPDAHTNLLFSTNYHHELSPQAIFEQHRAWGETHGRTRAGLPPAPNRREPERRLRIGYVTPDLRGHSVSYFIEPILARHDRERYEIYCYVEIPQPKYDATTERLKKLSAGWVDTCGLSDRALAEHMRADGIDILVDLAGHTANNRIRAFAYQPAPVQVTYLGYANTTGMAAIQYRLTDQWADPPGQEQFFTEELIRLPHGFLCYAPPADAPAVADTPAQTSGHLTLGSFNVLAKTTPQVVAFWAELLKALPDAHLLLKSRALADDGTRDRYYRQFSEHGIARERLELIGWTASRQEHLALYSRIDLGLDTFPYNGTTTTCEALWMGVPVIALAGDRHAARVGVSLLTRLGLTELIADSPDDYIRIAQRLSQDPKHLSELRHGLRARIQASTLGDAAAFTRELEDAYRKLWRRWCNNL